MHQALIYPGEAGLQVVEYPSLPGCISQGVTQDEMPSNFKEAIGEYAASLVDDGMPIPELT